MRVTITILIIIFAIFSCNSFKNQSPLSVEELTGHLLDEYIKQDSINIDVMISTQLRPYLHYSPEFSEEGYEAPPPPPTAYEGRYENEYKLVNYINEVNTAKYGTVDGVDPGIEYFKGEADLKHLKYQITQSKDLVSQINIKKWSKKYNSKVLDKDNGWYNFYIPLYNFDSTEVFLQYDYYYGTYGEGNGAVFIKKNGKWKFVRLIIGWMT